MLYEILHSNTSRTKSHFIHLGTSRQRNRDTKTKTSGHAGAEEGTDAGIINREETDKIGSIMEIKNITLEDLKEAYRKLKTYVYYDNFNLSLRMKLAEYENQNDLDKSLEKFLKSLKENSLSYSIDTYILPKKVKLPEVNPKKDNKQDSKITMVRNDISKIKNEIALSEGDYNHYIDAPIEVYLIDVLWIMMEGRYLINKEIKDNCYGNVLVFDKESEDDNPPIRKGTYLFERYFDKYQKWRDNGLKIAREQINNKNSVLLVCLDVQRFYPTSQIDFNKVRSKIKERVKSNKTELTDLLEDIYIKYQSRLTEQRFPQLPIGLLSSGVLANWYLNDFDTAIKERFNPVYYGRYVDDIFMVLANVKPDDNEDWFDNKFMYGDNTPLKKEENKKDYKLANYENLKINIEKLKLFYFSPEYSIAVLDNFQKRLDENSSAFWFLPEDDESTGSLNNEGFDIIYEDSINKFREISGIKNSKYGVSVFLAKQSKKEIFCKDSNRNRIKEEIFQYFKETTLLDMYSLWEKVFTYFVVTNDKKSFSMFRKMIEKAISQLKIENDSKKSNLLCESLISYCKYCMTMAKALNTDFKDEEDKDSITYLRKSYLIRQHYLPLPIIIYTRSGIEEKNLVSNEIYTSLTQSDNDFSFKEDFSKHPYPRKIHSHEICLLKLFEYIRTFPEKARMKEDEYIGRIIEELKDDYELGDDKIISKSEKPIILTKSDNKTVEDPKIVVEIPKISFKDENAENKQKIKVALSNIKINNKDIIESIKGKGILNSKKRQRHFRLLNMATQENADCLILPETSLPIELLVTYAEHSRRKQQLVILGMEHIISHDYCFNFSVVFLPYVYKGNKEVFVLPRLKNHYSPNECKEILRYNNVIPLRERNEETEIGKATYHLINWKGIQFTVFNCYELADVLHRSLFRSQIDILFAIEYNKDTYYYNNIVESTCRDLHCYFIQANTSDYGDSRLSIPQRHDDMSPVKIKGGDNDAIITFDVDIKKLRDFQRQNFIFQNTKEFKYTPPGFESKNVDERK